MTNSEGAITIGKGRFGKLPLSIVMVSRHTSPAEIQASYRDLLTLRNEIEAVLEGLKAKE